MVLVDHPEVKVRFRARSELPITPDELARVVLRANALLPGRVELTLAMNVPGGGQGFDVEVKTVGDVHAFFNKASSERQRALGSSAMETEWEASILEYPGDFGPELFLRVAYACEVLLGSWFDLDIKIGHRRRAEWECYIALSSVRRAHVDPHDASYWEAIQACSA
ncbi:MAG: hypothetical protein ACTSU5_15480 [Promethearchaeota archaeon]